MTKFEEFRDSIQNKAISIFNQTGTQGVPIWLAEDINGDRILFATPFQDSFDKDIIIAKIKEIFKEKDVCRYCFVSESWFIERQHDDGILPSECPDRKEALCIMGEDRDTGESCYIRMEIDRSQGGPVLKLAEEKTTPFAGRFVNMFDRTYTKH